MFSSVTFRTLTNWCGGIPHQDFESDKPVPDLNSDSRTLRPGEIFLALKGESYDGRAFIESAIAGGAAAIISEGTPIGKAPFLEVSDSLKALIAIGKGQRSLFHGSVVGVTGSAGKSSTKEMIATLLGGETVASPASFNNLIGVSKTTCLIKDTTKNLVLEMGMNATGEIAELCHTFSPEIGVITNIGDAHMGMLGGREGVYRAKKELFDFLAASPSCRGVALNSDDPFITKAYQECFSKRSIPTLSYSIAGKDSQAAVVILSSTFDPQTAFLNLDVQVEKTVFGCAIPIFGMHHVQNLAAAISTARLCGVTLSDIQARVTKIKPASHRGEIIAISKGRTLIDDCYNSNPTALLSSLESLMKIDGQKRLVIILGEMRELGEFTTAEHARVGGHLREWLEKRPKPSAVIGVGEATQHILLPLNGAKFVTTHHVDSVHSVPELLESLSQPGDIVFLKGSRGVKLDALIPFLAS